MNKTPTTLIIMDGFGLSNDTVGNAVRAANTPVLDGLFAEYAHTTLQASGLDVGLPAGQMGNSEVGHTNIGGGRVVFQDLPRITRSIEDGTFFENPAYNKAMDDCIEKGSALHLYGLHSTGGVHSTLDHLYALLKMAHIKGLKRVYIHAFLDGRDTPPTSGRDFVAKTMEKCRELGVGKIATVMGRYYAMDRDKRWDRNKLAWDAIVLGRGEQCTCSPSEYVEQCYAKGETDEFLKPGIFAYGNEQRVRDNDVVFFFNFRADRARQMSDAFLYPGFDGFDREVTPRVHYVTLTEYDAKYPSPIVFEQEQLDNIFGQIVSEAGKTQLRIAETEKYAHVTFFFNGGVETQFPGEDRILVPSPREVATYDLKPQMSAEEVADKFVDAVDKYDVVIMNFANGDMVGHTGFVEAGVAACEAVDSALEKCVKKVLALGGKLLITADHGNAEHMRNEDGSPNTAHTTNLVDLIYVADDKDQVNLSNGILADVAPTLLNLMGLKQPAEMSGHSLVTPKK